MKDPDLFAKMKVAGEKIAALTAYEASLAGVIAQAGCDTALVGDSLGMVIQGHRNTRAVTLADVCYHVSCVVRGSTKLHVMADLPFSSYENSPVQAFTSAAALVAAGAHMVKLEGGQNMAATVAYLVARGIPVCGHVGLLPQSSLGSGMRVHGKDATEADRILADAQAISAAGATLLVLEMIPAKLASEITANVAAATIGIGAGRDCDGQILVLHDVLGIYPKAPSFTKDFLNVDRSGSILGTLRSYVTAVKDQSFPGDSHIPA